MVEVNTKKHTRAGTKKKHWVSWNVSLPLQDTLPVPDSSMTLVYTLLVHQYLKKLARSCYSHMTARTGLKSKDSVENRLGFILLGFTRLMFNLRPDQPPTHLHSCSREVGCSGTPVTWHAHSFARVQIVKIWSQLVEAQKKCRVAANSTLGRADASLLG